MAKQLNGQVIFLKNKTIPIDKYEVISKEHNFEQIKFIPLIKHTNRPNEILKLFNDSTYLHTLKHIIITSQRTVECLYLEVIPKLNDSQQRQLFNKTVYTVGPATGEFLRNCGFKHVLGDDMGNGSNLADMIIGQRHDNRDDNDVFLFLVGLIRTDIIKNKLTTHGYKIKEVIAYATEVLDGNLVKLQHEVDLNMNNWIVIFSPQGIDDIIPYLKELLRIKGGSSIRIASIGPTTEAFLLRQGIKPHVISPKPTPETLLEAISTCMKF